MKKKLAAWITPLIITSVIFAFFVWNGYRKEDSRYIYINALTCSGAIVLLFALLLYFTQEGSLDMLIYGTRKFFKAFTRTRENDTFPKTYLEYVELKRERPKITLYPTFLIASIPIVIGLILYLVFNLEV